MRQLKKHFRQAVPIRPGFMGRVACGRMVESHLTTLVWRRVTCGACRRNADVKRRFIAAGLKPDTPADWAERERNPV